MRIRWRESPGSLASNSTSVGTQRTPWTIVPSATSCNWRFVTFSATVATYLQNQLSFPIYILARRCACSNLSYNWKPFVTGKETDTKTYSFVSPEDGCDTLCAKSPAHNKLPSLHSSTFYHVKPQCPTFKIISMHILYLGSISALQRAAAQHMSDAKLRTSLRSNYHILLIHYNLSWTSLKETAEIIESS